jgi:hypothetical protein
MRLQWTRLAVPNHWLATTESAVHSLFQDLGSPVPWNTAIFEAAKVIWVLLILVVCAELLILPIVSRYMQSPERVQRTQLSLLPSIGWVIGGMWIWHSKPEVWFMYYVHIAAWCLIGLSALKLWQSRSQFRLPSWIALTSSVTFITGIFGYVNLQQFERLQGTQSWNWPTYYSWVDCVDQRLTQLHKNLGNKKPFQVWDPTFPDITIELSRRHPDWEFTRTNDFSERNHLAIQHGWETDAVVVTETLNWAELNVSDKAENMPHLQSVWMRWQGYFLNTLWTSAGWKPNRYICQRGRWQAFLFMVPETLPSKKE